LGVVAPADSLIEKKTPQANAPALDVALLIARIDRLLSEFYRGQIDPSRALELYDLAIELKVLAEVVQLPTKL